MPSAVQDPTVVKNEAESGIRLDSRNLSGGECPHSGHSTADFHRRVRRDPSGRLFPSHHLTKCGYCHGGPEWRTGGVRSGDILVELAKRLPFVSLLSWRKLLYGIVLYP